jgi:beta-galactosidase
MIAEAVGQFSYGTAKTFSRKYRRAGDTTEQAQQALLHAQAHSRAGAYARCAGVIAWCAFDYASPMNSYAGVKCPGIADIFRLPKLGASFYLAQVEPSVRPVIEPSFYWGFGLHSPSGPGKHAAIFSNCDRLDIFIDNKLRAVLHPDTVNYPNLKYPPFFVDLDVDGSGNPELRIDGYVNQSRLLSRTFSSNTNDDELWLHAEDSEIEVDGSDATRIAFSVVDKYGTPRLFAAGQVSFQIEGPAILIGDNPFQLGESGGVGAVWIKSQTARMGKVTITAEHTSQGKKSLTIEVRQSSTKGNFI